MDALDQEEEGADPGAEEVGPEGKGPGHEEEGQGPGGEDHVHEDLEEVEDLQ